MTERKKVVDAKEAAVAETIQITAVARLQILRALPVRAATKPTRQIVVPAMQVSIWLKATRNVAVVLRTMLK
jgi:hypothetical protein